MKSLHGAHYIPIFCSIEQEPPASAGFPFICFNLHTWIDRCGPSWNSRPDERRPSLGRAPFVKEEGADQGAPAASHAENSPREEPGSSSVIPRPCFRSRCTRRGNSLKRKSRIAKKRLRYSDCSTRDRAIRIPARCRQQCFDRPTARTDLALRPHQSLPTDSHTIRYGRRSEILAAVRYQASVLCAHAGP